MKYPIDNLVKIYKENANPALVYDMERYMKNQFPFLGIKSPQRREINMQFFRKHGKPSLKQIIPLSRYLWEKNEREYQYLCMDLLKRFKNQWEVDHIDLIEYQIENKPWWDTVDFVASHLAGSYFQKFPEHISVYNAKWLNDKSMWFRRSAVLFQLKYKSRTDLNILTHNIDQLKSEKEFFIEKAIGWALREYSKTDPGWVENYVRKTELRPLSIREGLKWIHAHA